MNGAKKMPQKSTLPSMLPGQHRGDGPQWGFLSGAKRCQKGFPSLDASEEASRGRSSMGVRKRGYKEAKKKYPPFDASDEGISSKGVRKRG